MTRTRVAAIAAVALAAITTAIAVYFMIADFPVGLVVAILLIAAAVAAWRGLLRRGTPRVLGLAVAAVLAIASLIVVIINGGLLDEILVGVGALGTLTAGRLVFATHVPLPPAADPSRPVVFINPHSGDGKADRFSLERFLATVRARETTVALEGAIG